MSAYRRAKLFYWFQVVAGSMVFGAAIMAVLWLGLMLDCLVVLK
jgi:hypothetical protein